MRYRRWKIKLRQTWEYLTEPLYLNPAAIWDIRWFRQAAAALGLFVMLWAVSRLSYIPAVARLDSMVRAALNEPLDFRTARERVLSLEALRHARLTDVADRLGGPLALRSLQKNRSAPPDSTLVRFSYWPVQNAGVKVTSGFAWSGPSEGRESSLHEGIDLEAPEGAEVVAVSDGTVLRVAENAEIGKFLEIDHGRGLSTIYGHASVIKVKAGQKVKAGEIIAQVGRSGRAETSKLHFEVRVGGKAVDPVPFLGVNKTGN